VVDAAATLLVGCGPQQQQQQLRRRAAGSSAAVVATRVPMMPGSASSAPMASRLRSGSCSQVRSKWLENAVLDAHDLAAL